MPLGDDHALNSIVHVCQHQVPILQRHTSFLRNDYSTLIFMINPQSNSVCPLSLSPSLIQKPKPLYLVFQFAMGHPPRTARQRPLPVLSIGGPVNYSKRMQDPIVGYMLSSWTGSKARGEARLDALIGWLGLIATTTSITALPVPRYQT